MKKLSIALGLALLITHAPLDSVAANTTVQGEITQDTTWTLAASPYIMTDDVSVQEGATLTIEPGVVVQASSVAGLQVFGTLHAAGTPSDRIVFEPATDGSWRGIRLFHPAGQSTPSAQSVLQFVEVWESSDGLFIHGVSPVLSYNFFVGNGVAIKVAAAELASITDSVFVANRRAVTGNAKQVSLVRNDFWENVEAIVLSEGVEESLWDLHENDIFSTPRVRSGFAYVEPGGVVTDTCECDLLAGPPGGVVVDATNNWWGTTRAEEIEDRIVDQSEDPGYADVSWEPASSTPHTVWSGYKAKVSLNLRRHVIASGSVTSRDGFRACYSSVEVFLQRQARRGWSTVQQVVASDSGMFKTRLPDRGGRYRAVSGFSLSGPPDGGYCVGGVSVARHHSHSERG